MALWNDVREPVISSITNLPLTSVKQFVYWYNYIRLVSSLTHLMGMELPSIYERTPGRISCLLDQHQV